MWATAWQWLRLAVTLSVVRRALVAGLFVGCIQIAINHGDALLVGDVTARRIVKMILTSMVPYLVSTFSSVGAIRTMQRKAIAVEASPRGPGARGQSA